MSSKEYQLKPHEKPFMIGSPATPDHPMARRIMYALIGVLIGLSSGSTNAFLLANLPQIQGQLGLSAIELGWIQATYYMFNAIMSSLMFKIRQAYGLIHVVRYLIIGSIVMNLLQFFFHSYHTELVARAMAGIVSSGLTSICMYYIMQSLSPAHRIKGLFIGLAITQISFPFAKIISPALTQTGSLSYVFAMQTGAAMLVCASIWLLPLPKSDRKNTFEKLDFVSFVFLAIGVAFTCAAVTQGRIVWWDKPWIGIYFLIGFVSVLTGVIIEYNRKNPMFDIKWIVHANGMLQVAIFGALIRISLSEQSIGSAGFLSLLGFNQEEIKPLNITILIGVILGLLVSIKTFDLKKVKQPIALSFLIISIASWMEVGQGSLSGLQNFYLPEFMIAFASLYFFGPMMIEGSMRALIKGPNYIMSFIAVFAYSQTVGGLIGVAILDAFLTIRTRIHLINLAPSMEISNPVVNQMIQNSSLLYKTHTLDSVQIHAQSIATVIQNATISARISAFDDLFFLISTVAFLGFILVLAQIIWHKYRGTNPLDKELKALAQIKAKAMEAAKSAENMQTVSAKESS